MTFSDSVKIVRLRSHRTHNQRQNSFCFHVYDSILVLNSAFHANKSFMDNHHRIGPVHIRHDNYVGVTRFIF